MKFFTPWDDEAPKDVYEELQRLEEEWCLDFRVTPHYCPSCEEYFPYEGGFKPNYCPNCGVKAEEE